MFRQPTFYFLCFVVVAPTIFYALTTSEPQAKAGIFELNTVVGSIQNVEKVLLRIEVTLNKIERQFK